MSGLQFLAYFMATLFLGPTILLLAVLVSWLFDVTAEWLGWE
jgi:hypothetical protein